MYVHFLSKTCLAHLLALFLLRGIDAQLHPAKWMEDWSHVVAECLIELQEVEEEPVRTLREQ